MAQAEVEGERAGRGIVLAAEEEGDGQVRDQRRVAVVDGEAAERSGAGDVEADLAGGWGGEGGADEGGRAGHEIGFCDLRFARVSRNI